MNIETSDCIKRIKTLTLLTSKKLYINSKENQEEGRNFVVAYGDGSFPLPMKAIDEAALKKGARYNDG